MSLVGEPYTLHLSPALYQVYLERKRQDEKFGTERVVPDFRPALLERGTTPKELANEYEIPHEQRAKFLCDSNFAKGQGSSMDILVEEIAELTGAWNDPEKLKTELIQCAAVCVFWYEQIQKRLGVTPEPIKIEVSAIEHNAT